MSISGDIHRYHEMEKELRTGKLTVSSAINEVVFREGCSVSNAIAKVDKMLDSSRITIRDPNPYRRY